MIKTQNKNELNKYNREKEWALILVRYINSKGNDYIISEDYIPPANWADVDVSAKSSSGNFPPLYMQLCLDVEPGNEGYEKIRGNINAHSFNNFGKTLDAIKYKADKYAKQGKDISQITLLVQSYYLIEGDKKYRIPELQDKCRQYKFKAIYILSPRGQIYGGDKQIEEDPEQVYQII